MLLYLFDIKITNCIILKLMSLSSNAQEHKDVCKPSKPCHVGIHWIALTEYSHFELSKLATNSIRVNA